MKTTFHTIAEIIDRKIETPIDLAVIPNYMGINLCAVEAMAWTKGDDGQLVSLTIHFLPDDSTRTSSAAPPVAIEQEAT